ncbi:MAG TPA: CHAT domain-containing tetratricopeptide repeat protein, partial [Rudaea sp.]|nr:CHAT domain-containing tetratricopeptide repeat protein [Rudaea sp.]
ITRFDAHGIADLRTVRALQWLAACDIRMGKWDDAQYVIDRAIALATQLAGADSALVADNIVVAAYIPRYRGDVATAIGMLERALPLLRDSTPRRRAAYARALQAQAELLRTSGERRRAEHLFRTGVAAEEDAPSAGGYWLAGFLNGLGLCLIAEGEFAEATPYLERARTLFQTLYGPDSRTSWILEGNLAITYQYTGRLDEAAALLRHVIEGSDRARAADAADVTPSREKLGTLYLWQGRYREAETMFREYLAHAAHDLGSVERNAGESMAGLAAALWAQGRTDEAFAQAIAAEQWRQRLLRTTGSALAEQHAIDMRASKSGGLDWAIAIAARKHSAAQIRAAWTLAVESRGSVSAISAHRLAIARAATDPAVAAAWDAWKQRDEALVQARLDLARNPTAPASAALDAAESAFDGAERALARTTGSSSAPSDHGREGLATVLDALPADTLLVTYAETAIGETRDLGRLQESERHPRVYAFVARRGAAPDVLDLGPRAQVEAAVQGWLPLLARRDGDPRARTEAGRRVRELIWDPIAKRWPQHRVLLLPSTTLERVPFAALTADDGRFLVEAGFAFHLLDHERDVLARAPASGARTLTLIGAPDFGVAAQTVAGTRSVCSGLNGATFTPLPQAAREIEEIRRLWLQQAGTAPPYVLTGADADEARARTAIQGSRIVHFATHGLFLDRECEVSSPHDRGLKTVDTAASIEFEPLEGLSALVLTGANRPATTTENDGLLTSEEIAAFDLSGTDWAVLSACDTGIGKDVGGEGVFGLRRAFRMAGARSVVMSLWPVDDRSSADWMIVLYRERLQRHATTIDAVRAADLALIRERRDAGLDPAPFYWAAFVAAGDWR